MKNMTVRLKEEEIEQLEDEAKERDESRSEYVRTIIRNRDGTHSAVDSDAESALLREALSRLEGEVERLHKENDRLTRQIEAEPAPAVEDGSDNGSPGLFSRAKFWIFGTPDNSEES